MNTNNHNGRLIIASILILLSILFSLFNISFILGITFNFGSIFLLLLIGLFGLRFALPTVLFTYFISIIFLNGSAYEILPLLEVITVGLIVKKLKGSSLFVPDLIFWLVFGPLAFLVYNQISPEQDLLETIPFSIAFMVTNGLFNALIADIMITYFPLNRWLEKDSSGSYLVNLYKILFHMVIIAVIVPFVISGGVSTVNVYERTRVSSEQLAKTSVGSIESDLSKWSNEDILHLKLNGVIHIGYLKDLIRKYTNETNYHVVITDKQQNIVTSNLPNKSSKEVSRFGRTSQTMEAGRLYETLPPKNKHTTELERWASGYLTYEKYNELTGLTIFILIPIYHFQEIIYEDFLNQFQFILMFTGVFFIIAFVINRLFVRTLSQL